MELRKDGFREHFSDAWNLMDLTMYFTLVAVLAVHFQAEYYWPNVYGENLADMVKEGKGRFVAVATSARLEDISRKIFGMVSMCFSFRMLEYFSEVSLRVVL